MRAARSIASGVGAVLAFLVLFSLGSALVPEHVVERSPEAQQSTLVALLAVAVLDTAILAALARSSRLRGWRLWALLSAFTWFVMSVTSQLEAVYFMPNVTALMLPWLLGMTLPLALLFPPVLLGLFGLWRRDPSLEPAWERGNTTPLRVAVLSAFVYPALFFGAGYFIAWQSPAVREFYTGSQRLPGVAEHLAGVFAADPFVYPFEVLRGLLWVAAAVPVLRTTRGPWWWGALLVALAFALVQNDLHLLPNPLMPRTVSLVHFVETASSNFVWAWAIAALTRVSDSAAALRPAQLRS